MFFIFVSGAAMYICFGQAPISSVNFNLVFFSFHFFQSNLTISCFVDQSELGMTALLTIRRSTNLMKQCLFMIA